MKNKYTYTLDKYMTTIKRNLTFLCILMLTLVTLMSDTNTYAGDIPESLLISDNAQLFLAEVTHYDTDTEDADIELSAILKIKGDVQLGIKDSYESPYPMGSFPIKVGNVYLVTAYDNEQTNLYEITTYNTKTLKLVGVTGSMYERFEQYINDGRYEDAEIKRLSTLGLTRSEIEKEMTPTSHRVFLSSKPSTLSKIFTLSGTLLLCAGIMLILCNLIFKSSKRTKT